MQHQDSIEQNDDGQYSEGYYPQYESRGADKTPRHAAPKRNIPQQYSHEEDEDGGDWC